ncbi:MAG: hypothetical protein ACO34C_06230, partial [Candidatus Kapaibacteriota bacterium]
LTDLTKSEYWQLVPLVIFIVWIGIYPKTFLSRTELYAQTLVGTIEKTVLGTSAYPKIKAQQIEEHSTHKSDH